jgi:hypothetical protein
MGMGCRARQFVHGKYYEEEGQVDGVWQSESHVPVW